MRSPLTKRLGLLAVSAAAVLGAACSNPTEVADLVASGETFKVDLPPTSTGFEVSGVRATGPGGTMPGPFTIRGAGLHYDEELQAQVVDITLINDSEESFAEPVALTFLFFAPRTVKVLNADNGEEGPGARFDFTFANEDGEWTPGEESLPRTVQLGIPEGISIGFIARVEVGQSGDMGTIAGGVWNDADKDFKFDHEEKGIPGATLRLTGNGIDPRETVTDEDGLFRFDGLESGTYTVHKLPMEGWTPTTTPEMTVLLTEEDGQVVDFHLAYFGCHKDNEDDDEDDDDEGDHGDDDDDVTR